MKKHKLKLSHTAQSIIMALICILVLPIVIAYFVIADDFKKEELRRRNDPININIRVDSNFCSSTTHLSTKNTTP